MWQMYIYKRLKLSVNKMRNSTISNICILYIAVKITDIQLSIWCDCFIVLDEQSYHCVD